MSDGSVRDVCARIRARAHAAVEAQRQQQPSALTREDMAADLFALRTLYLVCNTPHSFHHTHSLQPPSLSLSRNLPPTTQNCERDVEAKRTALAEAHRALAQQRAQVGALQTIAADLEAYVQQLRAL